MDATATETAEQVLPPKREERFKKIIEANGATIKPPEDYKIPDIYDFSGFSERDRQKLEEITGTLQRFTHLRTISDSCENHKERRAMKRKIIESVPPEEREPIAMFLGENKMRRNKLSDLQTANYLLTTIDDLPQEELASYINQAQILIRQTLPHIPQDDIRRIIDQAENDNPDIAKRLKNLRQPAIEAEVAPILTPLLRNPKTRDKYSHKIIDPLDGPTTPQIETVEKIADQVVKILNCLGNLNTKNSHA